MTDAEASLRPDSWEGYIGQKNLKAELEVQIDAAVKDNRMLRHILLAAPAGAGKTTLAELIADRARDEFTRLVMPLTPKALANALMNNSGILMLDELHRARPSEQEALLTVLEDGYLQDARGHRIEVELLTIIGATTESQKIIKPLWDRFEAAGGIPAFDSYTDDELARIVLGMAKMRGVEMNLQAATAYGRAAAGTPRLAAKFVNRHAELQTVSGETPEAIEVLASLRMTEDGLTPHHRQYLEILDTLGGTKGVAIIAKLLRRSPSVIEDLEILLVTRGYVEYGAGGREITSKGRHLVRGTPQRRRRVA